MLLFIIVFVFVHSVNLIWPGLARALFIYTVSIRVSPSYHRAGYRSVRGGLTDFLGRAERLWTSTIFCI